MLPRRWTDSRISKGSQCIAGTCDPTTGPRYRKLAFRQVREIRRIGAAQGEQRLRPCWGKVRAGRVADRLPHRGVGEERAHDLRAKMRGAVDIGNALVVGAAHAEARQETGRDMAIGDDSCALIRLHESERTAGQGDDAIRGKDDCPWLSCPGDTTDDLKASTPRRSSCPWFHVPRSQRNWFPSAISDSCVPMYPA